jgi:hypothetical protein
VLETADEPDIIIINHGTNDSAATTEVFSAAYHALLARLSIKFPGVYIFCMRPFNGVRSTEIAEAVDGFPCCLYVDTFGWGVTYSDGGHPDVAGGIAAGLRLAEEIRTTLKNYSPYWS